jgi:hypothetical protein
MAVALFSVPSVPPKQVFALLFYTPSHQLWKGAGAEAANDFPVIYFGLLGVL